MPVGEIKEFVRCLCILALKGEKLQLWAFLHIYATYCSSETHDRSRELPMGDSTNWDFCITCLQACLLPDVSLNTTCSNCLIDQSLQVEKCRSWQDMRHVTNTICTVTGYVLGDRIYTLARSNNAQNGHDLWVPPLPPRSSASPGRWLDCISFTYRLAFYPRRRDSDGPEGVDWFCADTLILIHSD